MIHDITDNPENILTQHGGNLSVIEKLYPNAPRPFIDLSTGINPYPYPLEIEPSAFFRLADVVETEKMIRAAADCYGIETKNINAASGMQPLMFAIASYYLQKFGSVKIAILSPTYSEYEKVWKAAGHEVLLVTDFAELERGDVAIVCSPNNPDGKIYNSEQLSGLKNKLLIIDESFADLLAAPVICEREFSTIRMRSCGKFFGLAGLRVSFAIAPDELSAWLRGVVGDWSVNTAACLSLPKIFADSLWQEQMRARLEGEAAVFRNELAKKGKIVGFTSLFTLIESENAQEIYYNLAKNGILVRKFTYNRNRLRFGLPHISDMERILKVLS